MLAIKTAVLQNGKYGFVFSFSLHGFKFRDAPELTAMMNATTVPALLTYEVTAIKVLTFYFYYISFYCIILLYLNVLIQSLTAI